MSGTMRRVLLMWCLLCALPSAADIVVIVHADNPSAQLSRKQVIDLFMGRHTAFPNGNSAQPMDLAAGTALRKQFYLRLTGKSEAQVDAYWAQLVFAGRMSPPPQLESSQAMLAAVRNNPAAIGFIEHGQTIDGVKVVLRLE